MEWLQKIYDEANKEAERIQSGMAIMYSYPYSEPDLMVIGDNPGGSTGDHSPTWPKEGSHEYFLYNYPLAVKMRKIFAGDKLTDLLRKSVKFNRNFFQSPDLEALKKYNLNTFEWCRPRVRQIIEQLKPKRIFAESFGTLDFLWHEFGYKSRQDLVKHNGRTIMIRQDSPPYYIIGVSHPTGGRPPLSDEAMNKCNEILLKLWAQN